MFWMTNSVDFLQRICPLPGSKGLTVSRVLFWGCANQLGNICCPSGKVTGVTVSGLDVHSDPPSSLSCCTPSALWGLQALQAQSPQSNYILIEACFNLYGAMGWAAPAVCLSVCLPPKGGHRLRQAQLRLVIGLRRHPKRPAAVWAADWSVSAGFWTCVPEFNFRIHFWTMWAYRNDGGSRALSEGLRVEAKQNGNLDLFSLKTVKFGATTKRNLSVMGIKSSPSLVL